MKTPLIAGALLAGLPLLPAQDQVAGRSDDRAVAGTLRLDELRERLVAAARLMRAFGIVHEPRPHRVVRRLLAQRLEETAALAALRL